MADGKRELWRSPKLYAGCIAFGLVLGASCPLWPEGARPVCQALSVQLKSLGLGWFGVGAGSSSPAVGASDGGA